MLDGWCFNAKYADYLHDCYDQFLWSLSFLLNLISSITFNVIIVCFVMTYTLGFSGRSSVIFNFFLPGILLRILTFLQPLQLVVVVVDFCLNFVSAMLNACVISSF